jgi:hypothetical protein
MTILFLFFALTDIGFQPFFCKNLIEGSTNESLKLKRGREWCPKFWGYVKNYLEGNLLNVVLILKSWTQFQISENKLADDYFELIAIL